MSHLTQAMEQDLAEGTTQQTEAGARERFNTLKLLVQELQQQLQENQSLIDQQSGTIQALHTQVNAQATTMARTTNATTTPQPKRQIGETIKPPYLKKFNGDPYKIQKYFLNIRTHFDYYFPTTFAPHKIAERIQYTGTRLKRAAAEWFDLILKDYKNNAKDKRT